ncbi:MAG: hypothetical protein IT282_06090 [Bacteroidetes bacterium]|nr:hypothetical protein [Bacteroidota bacterium]
MKTKLGVNPGNKHSLVDFAQGQLTSEESMEVLDLVEGDSQKTIDLETVIDILNAVEDADLFTDDSCKSDSAGRLSDLDHRFMSAIRAAALVVALLGATLIAQELSKPAMLEIAHVELQDFDLRTRGDGKLIMEVAYSLLSEGEYERTMKLVDWSLNVLPKGDDRAHAHILRGGMWLMKSENYTLGFFSHYDTTLVRLALEELAKARQDSDQRKVLETSLWLAIKGNLALGDRYQALEQTRQLLSVGGIRNADAFRLYQVLSED